MNKKDKTKCSPKKSNDEIVAEVLKGFWGNGEDRKKSKPGSRFLHLSSSDFQIPLSPAAAKRITAPITIQRKISAANKAGLFFSL